METHLYSYSYVASYIAIMHLQDKSAVMITESHYDVAIACVTSYVLINQFQLASYRDPTIHTHKFFNVSTIIPILDFVLCMYVEENYMAS